MTPTFNKYERNPFTSPRPDSVETVILRAGQSHVFKGTRIPDNCGHGPVTRCAEVVVGPDNTTCRHRFFTMGDGDSWSTQKKARYSDSLRIYPREHIVLTCDPHITVKE